MKHHLHVIPGSAGRRDEESPEEAYYFNTKVAPIVEEMATHIKGKLSHHLLCMCFWIDLYQNLLN